MRECSHLMACDSLAPMQLKRYVETGIDSKTSFRILCMYYNYSIILFTVCMYSAVIVIDYNNTSK